MPILDAKSAALFFVALGTLATVLGAYTDGWSKHMLVFLGGALAALGVTAIWLGWHV